MILVVGDMHYITGVICIAPVRIDAGHVHHKTGIINETA